MTGFSRISLIAVAISMSVLFSVNGLTASEVVKVDYRPELGKNSPKLDIYPFEGAKNAPVMIYVHGGAWKWGSRKRVGEKPSHFNNSGYVFVSVDYRLVPLVKVENQLEDIDHALGWVATNITKFGGDANNLHLMGHSAGAHLVSMTGVVPRENGRQLIRSRALRTIISNDTLAYDIPRIAKKSGGRLHRIYQNVFGIEEKRWRRLSPQYQVDSQRVLPAFHLLYSGRRNLMARKMFAESFKKKLKLVDANVALFDGSKYSHRQMTTLIGVDDRLTGAIDDFLQTHSK